jgi:hypothetical protein
MSAVNQLARAYAGVAHAVSYLENPLLLAIRLYWGFQFMQAHASWPRH